MYVCVPVTIVRTERILAKIKKNVFENDVSRSSHLPSNGVNNKILLPNLSLLLEGQTYKIVISM